MTTKIFNKKFSAKEAPGQPAQKGHHHRKLCRRKSRSWKSWFEGRDPTSSQDQYYALLPLDENERPSDLGKFYWLRRFSYLRNIWQKYRATLGVYSFRVFPAFFLEAKEANYGGFVLNFDETTLIWLS